MSLCFDRCVISISLGPFAEKSVFCTEDNGEFRGIVTSMQAYLCAGVVEWVSENPSDRLGSLAASCGRNGNEEEETVVCEECQNKMGQWHGFLEILKVSKDAIIAKENLQYFQDCIKVKKWEHEIATAFAKSQKPVGDMTSALDDAGDTGDTDSVLLKLEELKERKQVFERDYISTPNPFVTYCRIKNILFHIKEEDPKTGGDLCEQFEALWKSITSHI